MYHIAKVSIQLIYHDMIQSPTHISYYHIRCILHIACGQNLDQLSAILILSWEIGFALESINMSPSGAGNKTNHTTEVNQ